MDITILDIISKNAVSALAFVPRWAAGVSTIIIAGSAAVSIPFALSNTSLVGYALSKIKKRPMPSPHARCRHSSDIRTQTELYGAWVSIRDSWRNQYLREVMDKGERMLDMIAVRLKDNYREELKKHQEICETAKSNDYDNYSLMIDRWRLEMRDRFRMYARENGYYAMTEAEFAEYKLVKPQAMMANASDIFDLFHRSQFISRNRLKEINHGELSEIVRLIVQTFDYARSRSIYWCDIRKLKYQSWSDAHKVVYGVDPIERCE